MWRQRYRAEVKLQDELKPKHRTVQASSTVLTNSWSSSSGSSSRGRRQVRMAGPHSTGALKYLCGSRCQFSRTRLAKTPVNIKFMRIWIRQSFCTVPLILCIFGARVFINWLPLHFLLWCLHTHIYWQRRDNNLRTDKSLPQSNIVLLLEKGKDRKQFISNLSLCILGTLGDLIKSTYACKECWKMLLVPSGYGSIILIRKCNYSYEIKPSLSLV